MVHPMGQLWVKQCLTSSLMTSMMDNWHSGSLQTTWYWEEWMIQQIWLDCHLNRPPQAGEMGKQELHRVEQRKMPNPRGINPGTSIWWWTTGWKATLQRRNGNPGGQVECVINTCLQQRQAIAYWAAWGRALPTGQGRWSFPSIQFYWGQT